MAAIPETMTLGRLGISSAMALMLSAMATAAAAAATPGPATMRAAMADPLETDFVEYPTGATGSIIEGSFDATGYAESAGSGAESRASVLQALHDYGFVTGYGRTWHKSRSDDRLEELLLVFATDWGAATTAGTSKSPYERDPTFQSFFDPQLNQGAYGLTVLEGGYHWTVIIFTKGNEMFVLERGSGNAYPMIQARAQAQEALAVAPARVNLAAQGAPLANITGNLRLPAIGALVAMLISACAISVILFVVFKPRSRKVAP